MSLSNRGPSLAARAIFRFALIVDWAPRSVRIAYILLRLAATTASHFHLGIFASDRLENRLKSLAMRLAQNWPTQVGNAHASTNATLHVLTRAYSTGGHTRVVERWVGSRNPDRVHALVLTRRGQNADNLNGLENLTAVHASKTSWLRNVRWLVDVMSGYDVLVTHMHPNDVDAVLALWISKLRLNKKVAIFNHADHRFWIGLDTADVILEFRSFGAALTNSQRGSSRSVVVGLPAPSLTLNPHKDSVVESHKQLLLAVGRGHKFSHYAGTHSFAVFVSKFLTRNPGFRLLVVGPHRFSPIRRFKFPNLADVEFSGVTPPGELPELYSQAAVGLDSFPMSGGTVAVEMNVHGLPVVSLNCPTGLLDSLPLNDWVIADDYDSWERAILKVAARPNRSRSRETQAIGLDPWGYKVDALLDGTTPHTSTDGLAETQLQALHQFLWATEPRPSNIIAGRVL